MAGRIHAAGNSIRLRPISRRLSSCSHRTTSGPTLAVGQFHRRQGLRRPNATRRSIERCLLMTTDPGDLVLDPTCGSGTTAYVAEQWGRRWITMRHQPRRARPGPHAADGRASSRTTCWPTRPRASAKEAELTGKIAAADYKTDGDIRKGFVYKRVPHVTLKSHRQQPGHPRGHDARRDRRRHRRATPRPRLLYDKPVRGQRSASASPARSPSRACRRTACCPRTTSGRRREHGSGSATAAGAVRAR